MAKAIFGLFERFDQARMAVEDMVKVGAPRAQISLISNDQSDELRRIIDDYDIDTKDVNVRAEDDVTPAEGAGFGAVVGGLIGFGVAVIPGIGPALAAGPLVAVLTGSLTGLGSGAATGGITAALVDLGAEDDEAAAYVSGMQRGGTLVALNVINETEGDHARKIMLDNGAVNIAERVEPIEGAEALQFGETGPPSAANRAQGDEPGPYRPAD